jgi:hypothetical protein
MIIGDRAFSAKIFNAIVRSKNWTDTREIKIEKGVQPFPSLAPYLLFAKALTSYVFGLVFVVSFLLSMSPFVTACASHVERSEVAP